MSVVAFWNTAELNADPCRAPAPLDPRIRFEGDYMHEWRVYQQWDGELVPRGTVQATTTSAAFRKAKSLVGAPVLKYLRELF